MKTKNTPVIDFEKLMKKSQFDFDKVRKEIEEDERGITIKRACVVMQWKKGQEYVVELKRVKDWAQLTDWMIHLCGKGWMTPDRLKMFAEKVIEEKKWSRSCG